MLVNGRQKRPRPPPEANHLGRPRPVLLGMRAPTQSAHGRIDPSGGPEQLDMTATWTVPERTKASDSVYCGPRQLHGGRRAWRPNRVSTSDSNWPGRCERHLGRRYPRRGVRLAVASNAAWKRAKAGATWARTRASARAVGKRKRPKRATGPARTESANRQDGRGARTTPVGVRQRTREARVAVAASRRSVSSSPGSGVERAWADAASPFRRRASRCRPGTQGNGHAAVLETSC
jgi:hypothetical protein